MSTTEIFLIAMAIIFSVPYLVWRLGRTEYFAPLVVVQIIAGILLGPGVLGKAFPEFHHFVFSPPVVLALNGIAWWAVMLFVWMTWRVMFTRITTRCFRNTGKQNPVKTSR